MKKSRMNSGSPNKIAVQESAISAVPTMVGVESTKSPVLETRRFSELSFAARTWAAIVPDGISVDDMLKPEFWGPNARRVNARDTIEVVNDAFTLFAKFLVVSANGSVESIEVRELYHCDLMPPRIEERDVNGYSISWAGGFDKWIVTRTSDGHVMRRGVASHGEARYFVQTELTPRLAAGRAS